VDGVVTVSPKGVHCVPTLYGYGYRNGLPYREAAGFEEGQLDKTLTQVFQSTEGLDISTFCNSEIHTVIISGEVCT
jgi:hypothetical protein